MGTKNNPGNIDCYRAALPDEHVFVLLGRDPATPATIRFWIGERARLGKNTDADDLAKLGEAGQVADAAEAWRAGLIELADGGDPPWKLARPVSAIDEGEDRPIRIERQWSGESGGPVKFPDPALFYSDWVETEHLAVGTFYANEEKPHDSRGWAQTFAEAEARGWQFVGDLSPFTGVVVHQFRKAQTIDFSGWVSHPFGEPLPTDAPKVEVEPLDMRIANMQTRCVQALLAVPEHCRRRFVEAEYIDYARWELFVDRTTDASLLGRLVAVAEAFARSGTGPLDLGRGCEP